MKNVENHTGCRSNAANGEQLRRKGAMPTSVPSFKERRKLNGSIGICRKNDD